MLVMDLKALSGISTMFPGHCATSVVGRVQRAGVVFGEAGILAQLFN